MELTAYRPQPRLTLDVQGIAEEMIGNYCTAAGLNRADVINRRTDRKTITLRDCILYAVWKRVEQSRQCKTVKVRLIAKAFEIKENTAFDRLAKFEGNITLYHADLRQFEEVSRLCSAK